MISIVIPAFNQVEYCRQCVHSVLLNTEPPYKLILVDNGSTDDVPAFFDSVPGATVVHSPTNLGFAGGVNLGLERAEGHVLLLNSDTLTPRSWLRRLERALDQSEGIGMVGPRSNCVSGGQQIDGLAFSSLEEITVFADDLAVRRAGVVRDVARLVGFCLLIRDRVVQEIGRFDESYGIGNFEDDDYCLRVLRAGYRLCVAEDAFVFHYGSRTLIGMGMVDMAWQELIGRNERIFSEKWAVRPEERSDAVQQSRRLNQEARRAFEDASFAEAIRLYKTAIETAPTYEINYNDLGATLWKMGERERACEQFRRALRLNPRYGEARENLLHAGDALGMRREFEQFLRSLDEKELRRA